MTQWSRTLAAFENFFFRDHDVNEKKIFWNLIFLNIKVSVRKELRYLNIQMI